MKVLHLISGGDTGGAKTHVFALLAKLKDLADVKIVCFMEGVFWDELQEIGVDCELIKQKSRFDLSVLNRLCALCAEGVDVIHCHGARANFIAAFLKRRVDVPMVTTIHSDYLLDFDGFYRKIVYTGLNLWALKRFRYFIGVSSAFKDMLIERGFRPNSVFTVYNGMDYDVPVAYAEKADFAARVGIPYDENCVYIGLIGRHDYVKGHDVFIRAIKDVAKVCPEARFLIAGEGENREALVTLAKEEDVADRLFFVGFVKDIYSFIHFIDINTLTSRSESFPYVLMEGARMSKPTVCSRVGGIPDLIRDGETGLLFESENSAELAEKLISFIRDRDFAARCGKALRTLAVTTFSSEALAKKHMEIYEAIGRDSREKTRYDVVLSGYYGFSNCGDDALLFAITESLRQKMPDVRIGVLAAHVKRSRKEYRLDCLPRFSPLAVIRTLSRSKFLLFGGGSLIQDATSSQSLYYYLAVLALAKRLKKPVYVYANGLGPIKDRNVKRAAKVLANADLITLRDELSLEELDRMGLAEKADVRVTADPALLLDGVSKAAADGILQKEGVPAGARILCFALLDRFADRERAIEALAGAARYARDTYGLVPVFLPMRFPTDVAMGKAVADRIGGDAHVIAHKYGVREMIGLIARSEVLIGMRLHALIFAAGAGVPSIGVSYDKKVEGFLRYIGTERFVQADAPDEAALERYLDEVTATRGDILAALAVKRKTLREKAAENADMAMRFLR